MTETKRLGTLFALLFGVSFTSPDFGGLRS